MSLPIRRDGPPAGYRVFKPPAPPADEDAAEFDRFYRRSPWRRLRARKIDLDPLCEECRAAGIHTPAAHVHHVKDRAERPDLALDLGNLQSLCLRCHARETMRRNHLRAGSPVASRNRRN